MNKLIILTGDLASGKSTLADSLSLYLHIPAIKKDTLKEKICDAVGFETREENRKISIATVDTMIEIFECGAKVGADYIFDANFRANELYQFKRICSIYNYQAVVISLFGDKELLYSRFKDRLPLRHKAHTSLRLDEDFQKYSDYIDSIRQEDLAFSNINYIDVTNLNEKEVFKKALEILEKERLI